MLSRCEVATSVIQSCLTHALSCEHEEIMGLLLGHVNSNTSTVTITRSLILNRRDKQIDRVEVGFEDLSNASTIVENMSHRIQRNNKNINNDTDNSQQIRIIGWYHSHPHITVLPSSVDVRTQGEYQALDSGFIGLIFSAFDVGKFEVCAFQSLQIEGSWERSEIPMFITPNEFHGKCTDYDSLLTLQVSFLNEERKMLHAALLDLNSNNIDTKNKNNTNASQHSHKNMSKIMQSVGNVYCTSTQDIVNTQISPCILALTSKRDTLLRKKNELVDKLNKLQQLNNSKKFMATSTVVHTLTALPCMLESYPIYVSQNNCCQFLLSNFTIPLIITHEEDSLDIPCTFHSLLCRISPAIVNMTGNTHSPWCIAIANIQYFILQMSTYNSQSMSVVLRCCTCAGAEDSATVVHLLEFVFKANSGESSGNARLFEAFKSLNSTLLLTPE